MTPPPATKGRPAPDRARDPASTGERRVVLAVVAGAHGIGGEVRLKLFADDLAAHPRLNDGALTLVSSRPTTNGVIARLAEVSDRNAAEAMRGTELWVPRESLPPLGEGEYYHADLLDLPVVDDAGTAIGRVVAIDNFGAGDVIEIERPTGKRFMVPMTPVAVPEWDDQRLVVAAAFVDA